MKHKAVNLTIQKWGNSLAMRIPSGIAQDAHFQPGTLVEISLQEVGITVKPVGVRKLTLEERLRLFDPDIHGTEIVTSGCVGKEKFE